MANEKNYDKQIAFINVALVILALIVMACLIMITITVQEQKELQKEIQEHKKELNLFKR